MKRKPEEEDEKGNGCDERIIYLTSNKKSWIQLYDPLPDDLLTDTIIDDLWSLCPEKESYLKVFGKQVKVPRFHQTYSDTISHYRFSGTDHESLKIPELLKPFMTYANNLDSRFKFNMCFVNWYRNGLDYIGYHADNEPQIYRDKKGRINVLSISIGSTRSFLLKPNDNDDVTVGNIVNHRTELGHGSVIAMRGLTQSTHKHSILKINNKKKALECGKRINITFRRFKDES